MDFSDVNWRLLGLVVGTFWGIFAFVDYTPHPLPWATNDKEGNQKQRNTWGKAKDIGRSILYPPYQFVFNFISGFAGCIGLGLFIERYSDGHLGWPELVLVLVALAGVMGKLAEVIFIVPNLLKTLMDVLAKKLDKS